MDGVLYHEESEEITWEKCTMRNWLNDTFYHTAFTSEEQSLIETTHIINNSNALTGADGGNDTDDKIFLLSIEEAFRYFTDMNSLSAKATTQAIYNNVQCSSNNGFSSWWLRSPGKSNWGAAFMTTDGFVTYDGDNTLDYRMAVRPAMWITLEEIPEYKQLFVPTFIPAKDIVSIDDAKVGETVIFGSYEQDGNLANGAEDIEWLVLAEEADKVKVISKYALDAVPYHKDLVAVTWEECTLRRWLNDTFYNTAFTNVERNRIETTYVTNNDNTYYSQTDAGNDTYDKIFLLSLDEAINGSLYAQATPYAYQNGAKVYVRSTDLNKYHYDYGVETMFDGNAWWWLRSPGRYTQHASYVDYGASVDTNGWQVNVTDKAVRPAMWLNMEL